MLVLTITLWFLETTIGAGNPEGNVHSTVRRKKSSNSHPGDLPIPGGCSTEESWVVRSCPRFSPQVSSWWKIELKNFVWVQTKRLVKTLHWKKDSGVVFFFAVFVGCFWEDLGKQLVVMSWWFWLWWKFQRSIGLKGAWSFQNFR